MRLKELREQTGLTIAEVAHSIGINRSAYANYECRIRPLPCDVLILLADYYNVTTDYILGRDIKEKNPA